MFRVSNYQTPSVDDFSAELNYVTASEEVNSEKSIKNEVDTPQDSRLNIDDKIAESCGNKDMRARIPRITDADIDKLLTGKSELLLNDIRKLLPNWLHDKITAFLPRLADELLLRRVWDHKTEIMPGKETQCQKNRPLSPREVAVVRNGLMNN